MTADAFDALDTLLIQAVLRYGYACQHNDTPGAVDAWADLIEIRYRLRCLALSRGVNQTTLVGLRRLAMAGFARP